MIHRPVFELYLTEISKIAMSLMNKNVCICSCIVFELKSGKALYWNFIWPICIQNVFFDPTLWPCLMYYRKFACVYLCFKILPGLLMINKTM